MPPMSKAQRNKQIKSIQEEPPPTPPLPTSPWLPGLWGGVNGLNWSTKFSKTLECQMGRVPWPPGLRFRPGEPPVTFTLDLTEHMTCTEFPPTPAPPEEKSQERQPSSSSPALVP